MSELTKEDCLAIVANCCGDPVLFNETFLLHWFEKKIPWVHRGVLALLIGQCDFLIKYGELDKIVRHFVYKINPSDEKSPELPIFELSSDGTSIRFAKLPENVLIIMPRGFAKTTLSNAANLYLICYHETDFMLYASETGAHARTQLTNVRNELETNEMLRVVFGNKVPSRGDSKKWTEDLIETTDNYAVAARGRGEQVRGTLLKGRRPKRAIADDIEDDESVSTPDQLAKASRWFHKSFRPALAKGGSVVVLATILARDALVMKLKLDPSFTTVHFGAIDRDGDPLWADHMTLAELKKLKLSYIIAGELSAFNMEYLSVVRDEKTAKFKKSYFQWGPCDLSLIAATAIAGDPAISDKRTADEATIGVASMLTTGKIIVRECWGERGVSPRDYINKYFEIAKIFHPQQHGIETIAYQKSLVFLMSEEMARQAYYFEPLHITSNINKYIRINGVLQPRYAGGYVQHERQFPELEDQLLNFGQKGVKDDRADVIAMAVALLDPYAAQAADPNTDLAANQFKPIDEELDGSFCHAP